MSFAYGGSGNVAVSYDYEVESEANFDYMYFEVDTSGAGDVVTVHTYTGTVSGNASTTLTEGADMRSDAGSYMTGSHVMIDGGMQLGPVKPLNG